MTTITSLMDVAKQDSIDTDWIFGESYYKTIMCRYNPETNCFTFSIDQKKATKEAVEVLLNSIKNKSK